jgi:hypothetical protein
MNPKQLDGKEILKKIIEEEGSCCWSKPSICAKCPLSKLKKKANGDWMSCIEAINIEHLTEEAADARYKEVAGRILLDEAIDEILGSSDGSK